MVQSFEIVSVAPDGSFSAKSYQNGILQGTYTYYNKDSFLISATKYNIDVWTRVQNIAAAWGIRFVTGVETGTGTGITGTETKTGMDIKTILLLLGAGVAVIYFLGKGRR